MRFPGAEQLGWIQTTGGTSPYNHTSLPDYLDLARENRTFDAIIAEARVPLSLAADGPAEQVWSLVVSSNYLDAMRAKPLVGRTLTDRRRAQAPISPSSSANASGRTASTAASRSPDARCR